MPPTIGPEPEPPVSNAQPFYRGNLSLENLRVASVSLFPLGTKSESKAIRYGTMPSIW